MKIAYVTTTFRRFEHLRRTVPEGVSELRAHPDVTQVFHVLDYGSDEGEAEMLLRTCRPYVSQGRLVVWSMAPQPFYTGSHAKNLAMRLAIMEGADVVVTVDADTYVDPEYAKHLTALRNPGLYIYGGAHRQSTAGRVAVRSEDFVAIRGYDEVNIRGWGAQDTDVFSRLTSHGLSCLNIGIPRFIEHDDELRWRNLDPKTWKSECGKGWKYTGYSFTHLPHRKVNPDGWGAGVVFRNGKPDPIVVAKEI